MKHFIRKNNWLNRGDFIDFGWGNGYTIIPRGHLLHGKDYNEINKLFPKLNVNGGLTFSGMADDLQWEELPDGSVGGWVVGFDTAHRNNTLKMWSKTKVLKEAKSLKKQLLKYTSM